MLHARTALGHPRLHQGVSKALSTIDATIKSVRSIINDLRPFELELGLQAAVEWQLKKFERISGIACLLSIRETTRPGTMLSDQQTLTIFQILQESLSNIVRHSHASRAEVMLSWNERDLSMTVKDNGAGIIGEGNANSFGIVGIRERVSALGGELVITGNQRKNRRSTDATHGQDNDCGTLLSVFIPIRAIA
jgi:signal transduction histidine kinase